MEILIPIVLLIIWFVGSRLNKAASATRADPGHNARLQKLVETFQAQQSGKTPPPVQGQFTQPVGGSPGFSYPQPAQHSQPAQYPQYSEPVRSPLAQVSQSLTPAKDSTQIAGMHAQLVQEVRSPRERRRAAASGQQPGPPLPSGPGQVVHNAGPAQWVPHQLYPVESPQYQQPYYPQAPLPHQPISRNDTDHRVRELMKDGKVIAAVRLLSDEQDMGILEAQQYAQSLVAPQEAVASSETAEVSDDSAAVVDGGSAAISGGDGEPYLGSAAFAESLFDRNHDDGTWASGWTEPADDPADRADIDELWQTVRTPPRPPGTPQS